MTTRGWWSETFIIIASLLKCLDFIKSGKKKVQRIKD